jgi:hypothetical protein
MRGSLKATSSVGQRFSPEAFAQMVAQDICSGIYLTEEMIFDSFGIYERTF